MKKKRNIMVNNLQKIELPDSIKDNSDELEEFTSKS